MMGNVHHGIPRKLALELRDRYGLKVFVETGSYVGGTLFWASLHFDKAIGIEINRFYYKFTKKTCQGARNVVMLRGDSRTELSRALSLAESHALVWLDAHWSPDLEAQKPERGECPILDELRALNADGRPHVILVDDARLFDPPVNEEWPGIGEILELLTECPRTVRVFEDVIIAEPENEDHGS